MKRKHTIGYGKRILCSILVFLFSICLFTGCGEEENYSGIKVYYVNREATKVIAEQAEEELALLQGEKLIEGLLKALSVSPDFSKEIAPLDGEITVLSYTLQEGQLSLDFSEQYRSLEPITEVLYRAAIVRTLSQVDGVDTIIFSVAGENLLDATGVPVGGMTKETFIDNAGTQINAYASTKVHLYFASEDGTELVEAEKDVLYNTNIPLEKIVLEELIAGPMGNGMDVVVPGFEAGEEGVPAGTQYPVLNPETTVLQVTVKDGVCYVNLSEEFLSQMYNVTPEVAIYSITNSLAELVGINKVQISVDGDSDVLFRESINLSTAFERNLDIIQK